MKLHPSIVLPCALAAATFMFDAQAGSLSVEAFDNATVQPGGPRGGSSGKAFFNIEGADYGSFASYGVARFDIESLKQSFDNEFGAGGWKLDRVELGLTQANAGFTTNGSVGIRHTGNDSVDLQPGTSPLAYPVVGDFTDLATLLDYSFTQIATGTLEQYTLFEAGSGNAAGAVQLVADVMTDSIVSLVFVDLDPTVAATYAGFSNNSHSGPTLGLTVSAVPVPGTLPLLASAIAIFGALRRRV